MLNVRSRAGAVHPLKRRFTAANRRKHKYVCQPCNWMPARPRTATGRKRYCAIIKVLNGPCHQRDLCFWRKRSGPLGRDCKRGLWTARLHPPAAAVHSTFAGLPCHGLKPRFFLCARLNLQSVPLLHAAATACAAMCHGCREASGLVPFDLRLSGDTWRR